MTDTEGMPHCAGCGWLLDAYGLRGKALKAPDGIRGIYLCELCAEKVVDPLVRVGDFERQLGRVPTAFAGREVDREAPFWDEFWRIITEVK